MDFMRALYHLLQWVILNVYQVFMTVIIDFWADVDSVSIADKTQNQI
jgi:hypothetical protein